MRRPARSARPLRRSWRASVKRILAYFLLALSFALPPLAYALLLREPAACGSPGDSGCPPQVPPSPVDVVGVSLSGGCVAAAAVASLRRFLAPRRLFLLVSADAADACAAFAALPDVQCLPDAGLLPGVSRASVAAALAERYGAAAGGRHQGRDTAGWYLQQLLKLGAPLALPNLSSPFLLWDMDMVALRPLRLLHPDGAVRRHSGGGRLRSYGPALQRLTGLPLAWAADGSSYVTHQAVVHPATLRAMLAAFAASDAARCADAEPRLAAMPRWAAAVLCALDERRPALGFSEYASYAAWSEAKGGAPARAVRAGAWTRHPLGSRALLRAATALRGCCPSRALLAAAAAGGWEYTGWESRWGGGCGGARE